MRKEVEIQDISSHFSVYSYIQLNTKPHLLKHIKEGNVWEEFQKKVEYHQSDENTNIMMCDNYGFYDPRSRVLGTRVYCEPDQFIDDIEFQKNVASGDGEKSYKMIRYLFGIAEGAETEDLLPLNCNYHLLNSISFNKGCYLGQELTQRTFFTGVIRKRILPFILSDKLEFIKYGEKEFTDIPIMSVDNKYDLEMKGLEIKTDKNQTVGLVIANQYNCGIAMVNVEEIQGKDLRFSIEGDNAIIMDYSGLWKENI